MDAIKDIVLSFALGAGAVAGKELVSGMVKDAYAKVKEFLAKYAKVDDLEERPNSEHRRNELADDLAKTNAADDKELRNAARELLATVKSEAPFAAEVIGVEIRDVDAAFVHLTGIQSSGTGVLIENTSVPGGITAKNVKAGLSPPGKKKIDDLEELAGQTAIHIVGVDGSVILKNVSIVQYFYKERRRLWRPLEFVNYPVLSHSEHSKTALIADLREGAFVKSAEAYARFTVLLSYEQREFSGQAVHVYKIIGAQPEVFDTIRRGVSETISTAQMMQSLPEAARLREREKYKQKILALEKKWEGWTTSVEIAFQEIPVAVEITYDPAGRYFSCSSITGSLEPLDYEHHVSTTSEVLQYVSSALHTRIAIIGDIGAYAENPSLLKLLSYYLDNRQIDLGSIRVNSEDLEEWDYHNPAFDKEILENSSEEVRTAVSRFRTR